MNQSGTWFLLDKSFVKPPPGQHGFRLDQCIDNHNEMVMTSGYSRREIDGLYTIFPKGDASDLVEQELQSQRVAFAMLPS
jgi:hypothetical protein